MPDYDIRPTQDEDGITQRFPDPSISDFTKLGEEVQVHVQVDGCSCYYHLGQGATTCTFLASSCGLEFVVLAKDGKRCRKFSDTLNKAPQSQQSRGN